MPNPKKTILIVEDDSVLMKQMADQLTAEGFTVLQSENGELGLASALEHHPDLILSDVVMPKLNGIEMLKQLRTDDWGKTVPVIVLTNLSDSATMAQAVEGKAEEYVIKSNISLDEIVEKVKNKLTLN